MSFINSLRGKGGGTRLSPPVVLASNSAGACAGEDSASIWRSRWPPTRSKCRKQKPLFQIIMFTTYRSPRLCSFRGNLCHEMVPKYRKGTQSPTNFHARRERQGFLFPAWAPTVYSSVWAVWRRVSYVTKVVMPRVPCVKAFLLFSFASDMWRSHSKTDC